MQATYISTELKLDKPISYEFNIIKSNRLTCVVFVLFQNKVIKTNPTTPPYFFNSKSCARP